VRSHIAKATKGFVEHIFGRVAAAPAGVSLRICAQDMVVHQQMGIPQVLCGLHIVAHGHGISANLGLWEDDANLIPTHPFYA